MEQSNKLIILNKHRLKISKPVSCEILKIPFFISEYYDNIQLFHYKYSKYIHSDGGYC